MCEYARVMSTHDLDEVPRDYLAEARDIMYGVATPPRLLLRVTQREHLLALRDHYIERELKMAGSAMAEAEAELKGELE